jgi:hypothetical protein
MAAAMVGLMVDSMAMKQVVCLELQLVDSMAWPTAVVLVGLRDAT